MNIPKLIDDAARLEEEIRLHDAECLSARAVSEKVKMSGVAAVAAGFGVWQPIETAPRGETVLLYVSNAFGHKHVKTGIAYPTNHPDLEIVSIFDDGDALGYLPEKHVTHWMPLPTPPNNKVRDARAESGASPSVEAPTE